jgi:dipeptidyl aminopeptidase/acylaminoacyl peptidase
MRLRALVVGLLAAVVATGCGGPDIDIDDMGGGPKAAVRWAKPKGGDPDAVVILLHGGGWQPNESAFQGEMPLAAELRNRGYATVVVGYDEGARGFREIERVYSQAQRRYPRLPICAHGISAGGHLALMLATREPDLTCVVDLVGPTDLTTLEEQGGDEVHDLAVTAFGEAELEKWSPARYAGQINAEVLMILSETDPIIPVEQGEEFARALPGAELVVLPAGPTEVPWLHGASVTPESEARAVNEGFKFIAEATRDGD